MWDLFNDRVLLDNVINKLRPYSRIHSLNSYFLPKFVFICGKQILDSTGNLLTAEELERTENKRYHILDKLSSKTTQSVLSDSLKIFVPIISEKLYIQNKKAVVDLLTFEKLLADLSDYIILLLESPGTICELGAFSINDDIIKKLCVINGDHENEESFINAGPIKKVFETNGQNVFYLKDNYHEFKINSRISRYLDEIEKNPVTFIPNSNKDQLNIKSLIYELLSILEIFSPITDEELFDLYKEFKGFTNYKFECDYSRSLRTYKDVCSLMLNIDVIEQTGPSKRYIKSKNDYFFSCYNALFTIDHNIANSMRAHVLSRYNKKSPERMA